MECIIVSQLFGAPSYISVSRAIVLDYEVSCLVLVLERLDYALICEVNKEWFLDFDYEIMC